MTHFWFYVTSLENWHRIVQQKAIGIPKYNRHKIEMVKTGEQIVTYLKGEMTIAGVLEATSEPYVDETPLFTGDIFPYRISVILRYVAENRLSFDKKLILQLDFIKNKARWVSHIQGKNSFRELSENDFQRILVHLRPCDSVKVLGNPSSY